MPPQEKEEEIDFEDKWLLVIFSILFFTASVYNISVYFISRRQARAFQNQIQTPLNSRALDSREGTSFRKLFLFLLFIACLCNLQPFTSQTGRSDS